MEHYLDNSATTAVCKAAADAAYRIMTEVYGNPSSLHLMGVAAEHELNFARAEIASCLSVEPESITFTSGGTEANNMAVLGAARARKRTADKLVVSLTEHSSVLEAAARLELEGFRVSYVAPQSDGVIHAEDVLKEVDGKTALVSVMLVNNETGAVNPVDEIFSEVKSSYPDTLCHTDAVQAFGKLNIRAKALSADLLSVSGHKVFAPKGVGALYVKKGVRILPLHFGGEQERKLRPGTEALPLIAAMSAACREFDIKANSEKAAQLCGYAKEQLLGIDGVTLNSPENALPYVLNISAGRVRSETMLHFLEERGVYVSSGSACAKGKPSHVLSAMGIPRQRADSALRISFSKYNTKEDIDALREGIETGLKLLAQR